MWFCSLNLLIYFYCYCSTTTRRLKLDTQKKITLLRYVIKKENVPSVFKNTSLYNYIFLIGSRELLDLVTKNQDCHFFLDEVHVAQNQISSEVLAEISNTISRDNFLWIACQGDRPPSKSDSNLKGKNHICMS
jgi:hypothetical protein